MPYIIYAIYVYQYIPDTPALTHIWHTWSVWVYPEALTLSASTVVFETARSREGKQRHTLQHQPEHFPPSPEMVVRLVLCFDSR